MCQLPLASPCFLPDAAVTLRWYPACSQVLLGSEWLHLLSWMLRNGGIVHRGDESAFPSLHRGVFFLTKVHPVWGLKNRSWTVGVGVGAFAEST